jgi:hypothetical protein
VFCATQLPVPANQNGKNRDFLAEYAVESGSAGLYYERHGMRRGSACRLVPPQDKAMKFLFQISVQIWNERVARDD